MGPAAADTSASLTHINANLTFVFGENSNRFENVYQMMELNEKSGDR